MTAGDGKRQRPGDVPGGAPERPAENHGDIPAEEFRRAAHHVADLTADPPQTRLLCEAADLGCATLDGLSAYIEQVALGIEIWTGIDPDRNVMREAIEEFLEL